MYFEKRYIRLSYYAAVVNSTVVELGSGANPTTSSYNASSSLVRFKNKIFPSNLKKRSTYKFSSRKIRVHNKNYVHWKKTSFIILVFC
jgi:hypothetical protein